MSLIGRDRQAAFEGPRPEVIERAAEWVTRLNDAAVTEQDFMTWQAWLAEHSSHATAFQEMQDTWRRSASLSRASLASSHTLNRMRAELVEYVADSARRRTRMLRYTALAALLATAAVGLTIWHRAATTVETASGELRSIHLTDGSRAALGPETRITIDFSSHARRVSMTSGQAYFDVSHEANRTFTVDTPAGRVVALGTAFSVHAAGNHIAVSVLQGEVRVESADNRNATAAYTVSAGQRLVRDRTKTALERLASPEDALAWQSGRLEYQGEPLRVVIADVNRYSAIKFRIADPPLGEMRYTGTVFPDALDAWLASLDSVFPLQVDKQRNGEILLRAKAP